MPDKPTHPTTGGSFIRQDSGELKQVEATQSAPEPVNRASPQDPHPEPAAPSETTQES